MSRCDEKQLNVLTRITVLKIMMQVYKTIFAVVGFEVLIVVVMKSTSMKAGGKQTLKKAAKCSFETSIDTQRTTRHYIPEDGTLQYFTVVCTDEKCCFFF
jgi:hypothetical protein